MSRLSLRLRIFLFFAFLGMAGVGLIGLALYAGFARAQAPETAPAFVFSGVLAGFGLLALVLGIWLLFDENVAKPIERMAIRMRTQAHGDAAPKGAEPDAKYLGDLAPAVEAMSGKLSESTLSTAAAIASETARLAAEKDRLTALLSSIDAAMIMVGPEHRIVLYDGQAAAVLERVAPARLGARLFEYFQEDAIVAAVAALQSPGGEVDFEAVSLDGMERFSARVRALEGAPGYMLILDGEGQKLTPDKARPLIYDFELLDRSERQESLETKLCDLCFVVFDSETTGLNPERDRVVQIGAVRVLNGRIVEGEVFDRLVDPGCPIPAASTAVHKITDAMVSGAQDISQVGAALHGFARDAVLVAHNAPFDMGFLQRDAEAMGVVWDHPVVDTVLVSAVLFGTTEAHDLDSLCARFGIDIPPELRHSALGDAQATAEVLCKMLPILQGRGIETLADLIGEMRRHGRLLKDLNG